MFLSGSPPPPLKPHSSLPAPLRYHEGDPAPPQGVRQQLRELAVSKGDVALLPPRVQQQGDAVAWVGRARPSEVRPLAQGQAAGLCRAGSSTHAPMPSTGPGTRRGLRKWLANGLKEEALPARLLSTPSGVEVGRQACPFFPCWASAFPTARGQAERLRTHTVHLSVPPSQVRMQLFSSRIKFMGFLDSSTMF